MSIFEDKRRRREDLNDEEESSTIIPIRRTGMGASTRVKPLSPTVQVEERWGNTHGEARVWGSGLAFIRDVSNRGNHNCEVVELRNGKIVRVVERSSGGKFCPLCEKYWH